MKLKETIFLMISEDYKERFRAEYFQLQNRVEGLDAMLMKYKDGTLNFTPKCSYALLNSQLKAMLEYAHCLEERAIIEGIDLSEVSVNKKEQCPCMKEKSYNCGMKCSRCGREL